MTKSKASLEGPTPRAFWVPIIVGPNESALLNDRGTSQARRTDIERVSLLLGDPLGIHHDELLDQVGQGLSVECLKVSASGMSLIPKLDSQVKRYGLHSVTRSARHPQDTVSRTLFILAMFLSGRNNLTVPSSCLYAFIPSNLSHQRLPTRAAWTQRTE
jgi:hypothetical protein